MHLRLVWLLSFVLVFSLLIGLARQIGLNQTPTPILQHLHLTECSPPCWNGIMPGGTTGQEVVARLRSTFGLPENHIPLTRLGTAVTITSTIPLPTYEVPLYTRLLEIQLPLDLANPSERTITSIRWWFPATSGDAPFPA